MPPPAAPKPITFWMAVALVVGNMIGSGIFLLPASLAPYGGLSLVGWLFTTFGSAMLALVFARLAGIRPAPGGPYVYTRAAFGDFAGFLVAWGYWMSMWAALGALSVAFVGYLDPFIPGIVRTPALAATLAVSTVWVLVGVNIVGVRTAGWVQLVTTILKILPLLAIAILGLMAFQPAHFAVPEADARSTVGAVTAVATLTLWAFLGLESATVPAASIDDPARTIPRATVVGTLVAGALYIASTVGVMSLVEPSALGQSSAPFADAARTVGGEWAARAVALGAAISAFGALNGWTLLVGQLPLAIARDRLFPQIFAQVSSRGTPAAGMIIAGLLTTGLIAMNYTRGLVELFTFIILLSTLSTLVPYLFSSLSVFLVPGPEASGGRRISAGMTAVASLAFIYSIWAIGGAGAETVYWGFLALLCGVPVYVFVIRTSTRPGSHVGTR